MREKTNFLFVILLRFDRPTIDTALHTENKLHQRSHAKVVAFVGHHDI